MKYPPKPGIMKYFFILILIILFFNVNFAVSQEIVARIHYSGGGDWYGNRTTFQNIFKFIEKNNQLNFAEQDDKILLSENTLYKYPMLYISGHGNIKFSFEEINNLRKYLLNGGFLWADDDYGMNTSFQREMKKVFPELNWVEIEFSHPIYNILYKFSRGLPKIHEHDGGPPKGLGIFYDGKLIAFYSLNTDISDGCEDVEIHNDPADKREQAFKMAANIIFYALSQ